MAWHFELEGCIDGASIFVFIYQERSDFFFQARLSLYLHNRLVAKSWALAFRRPELKFRLFSFLTCNFSHVLCPHLWNGLVVLTLSDCSGTWLYPLICLQSSQETVEAAVIIRCSSISAMWTSMKHWEDLCRITFYTAERYKNLRAA